MSFAVLGRLDVSVAGSEEDGRGAGEQSADHEIYYDITNTILIIRALTCDWTGSPPPTAGPAHGCSSNLQQTGIRSGPSTVEAATSGKAGRKG